MKKYLSHIFVVLCASLLTYFAVVEIAKVREENNLKLIEYMYRSQIFLYELDKHSKLLTSQRQEKKLILNSYYHIYESVRTFKILQHDDMYKEIIHDYVVFLCDFGEYAESLGLRDQSTNIEDSMMDVVSKYHFVPKLKIDYEIKDINSLKRYIKEYRSYLDKVANPVRQLKAN